MKRSVIPQEIHSRDENIILRDSAIASRFYNRIEILQPHQVSISPHDKFTRMDQKSAPDDNLRHLCPR